MQTNDTEAWRQNHQLTKNMVRILIGMAIFAFLCAAWFDPTWAVIVCTISGVAFLVLAFTAHVMAKKIKTKYLTT